MHFFLETNQENMGKVTHGGDTLKEKFGWLIHPNKNNNDAL